MMGLWAPGVFGNDATADFALRFDRAAPEQRPGLLRDAFSQALQADNDDLGEYGACALAAAAIIAARLPEPPVMCLGYGPNTLPDFALRPPAELVSLALRAFDHVVTAQPEWAEMYSDAEHGAELVRLRTALAAASG